MVYTDISFNRETSMLLAEEISSQRENLALVVRFIEASDDFAGPDPSAPSSSSSSTPSGGDAGGARVFADAIVDLWVMIEDSCSIVRQVGRMCVWGGARVMCRVSPSVEIPTGWLAGTVLWAYLHCLSDSNCHQHLLTLY